MCLLKHDFVVKSSLCHYFDECANCFNKFLFWFVGFSVERWKQAEGNSSFSDETFVTCCCIINCIGLGTLCENYFIVQVKKYES